MRRKIIFVLVAIVLISVVGAQLGLSKEEEKADELDSAKIMRKLDKLLANQVEILKQFTQIKQELDIIKIRASR